jgi:hypothetical protein
VIADLERLKRGDGHFPYGRHIGVGFAPDNDIEIHVLLFLLP